MRVHELRQYTPIRIPTTTEENPHDHLHQNPLHAAELTATPSHNPFGKEAAYTTVCGMRTTDPIRLPAHKPVRKEQRRVSAEIRRAVRLNHLGTGSCRSGATGNAPRPGR